MPQYRVSSVVRGSLEIFAPNWVVALGKGFELFGVLGDIEAIACEVLPNGRVLVRDVTQGAGFVVSPAGGPPEHDDVTEEAVPDDIIIVAAEEPGTERPSGPDGIANAPTPVDACHRALAWACQIAQAESGAVLLLRRDGLLEFVAAAGPVSTGLVGRTLPTGTGFAYFCVQNLAAFNIRDAYGDPRFNMGIDVSTGYRTRALLCVPLIAAGQVFGCLELINRLGDGSFSRVARIDAETVAGHLAARLAPGS